MVQPACAKAGRLVTKRQEFTISLRFSLKMKMFVSRRVEMFRSSTPRLLSFSSSFERTMLGEVKFFLENDAKAFEEKLEVFISFDFF